MRRPGSSAPPPTAGPAESHWHKTTVTLGAAPPSPPPAGPGSCWSRGRLPPTGGDLYYYEGYSARRSRLLSTNPPPSPPSCAGQTQLKTLLERRDTDENRETLDALRFTPSKDGHRRDLLVAAQAGQVRAPRRKWGRVAAAAILAAALCAACASGALQEALSVLASQFGSDPEQQEVIGDLTRPSAASATDNGVTISVDAVMGDGNSLVVLYRMERADGQPVLPQTEETKNVSDGNNTLRFEMVDYPASIDSLSYPSGFLDFEVTDSTLYFYQRFTASQDFDPSQPVEITLKNLYSHEYYSTGISYNLKEAPVVDRIIPLVDGSWTLTVSLDSVDASLDLGSGQTFHAESNRYPLSGTILSLRLSSLSLVLDYAFTIDEDTRAALAAEHASNPELVANLPLEPWMFVTLTDFSPDEVPYLTLTDGSTLTLNDLGYATPTPLTEELDQCRLQFIFNEVLPLDTVASITIGDLTIPLPDA